MTESPATIVLEQVKALILSDGSHHPIHAGSLDIGPLVFRSADGSPRNAGAQAGFVAQRTDGTRLSGPVTAILATIG